MAHAWQGTADAIKPKDASRDHRAKRDVWHPGEALAFVFGASIILWLLLIGGLVLLFG